MKYKIFDKEKIMIIDSVEDWKKELSELLKTFDVPEGRKEDFGWIIRNISIRNSENPDLEKVLFAAKHLFNVDKM